MLPVLDLLNAFIQALPVFLLSPFFWVVVILIGVQYRRTAKLEKKLLGVNKYSLLQQILVSSAFGLVGGMVGSFVLVTVGVTLSDTGIDLIWPVAIALMLINPRLMCFAYAGGLVSLASLATGWPKVFVPGIMSLVAILHLTESALIFLSGHLNPSPIFIKGKDDNLVGAFSLQKFWPLPLIALSMAVLPRGMSTSGSIPMPDWWPLFRAAPIHPDTLFLMIPVVAGLGYGDLAVTMSPRQKSRSTAARLMFYSVTLLALSFGALRWPVLAWAAAIAAPLLHELLVVIGVVEEQEGVPLYRHPERGLMILDMVPHSAAQRMGLRPGDVILQVNDHEVHSVAEWTEAIGSDGPWTITVKSQTRMRRLHLSSMPDLGVIFAPDEAQEIYAEMRTNSPLIPFVRWLIARR